MCGLFPSNYAVEHPASSEGIQERIFPPRLLGIAWDCRQKQCNGKQLGTEAHDCFMPCHWMSLPISNSSTCFMEVHLCALFGCFSEYSVRFNVTQSHSSPPGHPSSRSEPSEAR